MELDINKIANIIADIQTEQEAFERYSKSVEVMRRELEDEETSVEDSAAHIRALRDELDSYLDEIIPETEKNRDEFSHDYTF